MQEDSFEYPGPDTNPSDWQGNGEDDIAEAQAHAEREREERDAAASEVVAGGDVPETDPHAEEREALGFDLPWWGEDGEYGLPSIDIASNLCNEACGRVQMLRKLEEHGYEIGTPSTVGLVALNDLTGPLVVAGLMLLGTLHFHLRKEITPLLKAIFDAVPEADDETNESFAVAMEKAQAEAWAEMGIQVMGLDEYVDQQADEQAKRDDASLN